MYILLFAQLYCFSADDGICSSVAEKPQNYLIPHPTDCKKYYSCRHRGWRGGWIAEIMNCPTTTGFDTRLGICNYIKALPRCIKGESAWFQIQYQYTSKNDYYFERFCNGIFVFLKGTSAPDIKIKSADRQYYEVYINKKSTWDEAWSTCMTRGGILATIHTITEKKSIEDNIARYLSQNGKKWENLWIGLKKGTV